MSFIDCKGFTKTRYNKPRKESKDELVFTEESRALLVFKSVGQIIALTDGGRCPP